MKRFIIKFGLLFSVLGALGGCAQLGTGYEVIAEKVCDAPAIERFARKALFDSMAGRAEIVAGTAVFGYDCNGDGAPDALGSWQAAP